MITKDNNFVVKIGGEDNNYYRIQKGLEEYAYSFIF